MNLLRELMTQRDRIAGKNGYRWVQHMPDSARETCAIMYGALCLSTAAHSALHKQLRVVKCTPLPPGGVSYYNDNEATHQDILDLFDGAIKEVAARES